MTYAIRNTLILLVFLLLITGGGFAYIYFFQVGSIENLQAEVDEKESEFNEKSAIADTYPVLLSAVESAEDFIENYDKTLFPDSNPDQVYRFLSEINANWPRVEFNYIFNDSTEQDLYGIVNSTISGVGSYRAIYNFINRIENSRPVQKVRNIQLSPIQQLGQYGDANFNFELQSYYNRSEHFNPRQEDLLVALNDPSLFHNPFFPMIRDIEPNEDNLTDVENSQLIGVSNSRIFLRNQDGQLVNLSLNEQVYLGSLQNINVQQGSATFRLNKGGIIEEITLEVRR